MTVSDSFALLNNAQHCSVITTTETTLNSYLSVADLSLEKSRIYNFFYEIYT